MSVQFTDLPCSTQDDHDALLCSGPKRWTGSLISPPDWWTTSPLISVFSERPRRGWTRGRTLNNVSHAYQQVHFQLNCSVCSEEWVIPHWSECCVLGQFHLQQIVLGNKMNHKNKLVYLCCLELCFSLRNETIFRGFCFLGLFWHRAVWDFVWKTDQERERQSEGLTKQTRHTHQQRERERACRSDRWTEWVCERAKESVWETDGKQNKSETDIEQVKERTELSKNTERANERAPERDGQRRRGIENIERQADGTNESVMERNRARHWASKRDRWTDDEWERHKTRAEETEREHKANEQNESETEGMSRKRERERE